MKKKKLLKTSLATQNLLQIRIVSLYMKSLAKIVPCYKITHAKNVSRKKCLMLQNFQGCKMSPATKRILQENVPYCNKFCAKKNILYKKRLLQKMPLATTCPLQQNVSCLKMSHAKNVSATKFLQPKMSPATKYLLVQTSAAT